MRKKHIVILDIVTKKRNMRKNTVNLAKVTTLYLQIMENVHPSESPHVTYTTKRYGQKRCTFIKHTPLKTKYCVIQRQQNIVTN